MYEIKSGRINYMCSILRETSDRICHSSVELRIICGFHASLLRHLLVLKGVTEMEVDRCYIIVIFESFRRMCYARRIFTLIRFTYNWPILVSELLLTLQKRVSV